MVVEFEVTVIAEKVRELSEKEMLLFFRSVPLSCEGSIGLMGGWAVTHLLKKRNLDHIGSRDIDVFYNPENVKYPYVRELILHSGFSAHSTFRWAKYFDARTGRVISEEDSKKLAYYDLAIVYLDVAAPSLGEEEAVLGRVLGEPLLGEVFAGKNEYWQLPNARILMPNVDIMLKMKIKSVLGRVDSFKREKDLADLIAMLRNVPELWILKGEYQDRLRDDLRDSNTLALKERLAGYSIDGTLVNAAGALNVDYGVALDILRRI